MSDHIRAWKSEYKRSSWRGRYSLKYIEPYDRKGLILDAGCGSGKYSVPLKMRGFEIIGLDISKEALKDARKSSQIRDLDIDFLAANVYETPFMDSSFDIIWCYGVLQHLLCRERELAVDEFRRILRNVGMLFIEILGDQDMRYGGTEIEPGTFTRKSGIVYHYFNKKELKDLFKEFSIDIFEEQKEKQFEGKVYRRHIISVVARKS